MSLPRQAQPIEQDYMPCCRGDSVSERYPAGFQRWFFLPPLVALVLLLLVLLAGGDMQVFLWLNRICLFAGDMFWLSVTTFGDGLVVCVLILPFIRRKPELVWAMLLSWLLMTLWVQGLKFLINTPRPLARLSASDFHIIGALYKSKSFPSGHAATASMFAAIFCLFFRRKWIYTVVILLAVMISLSRIAMGIHWPTDVLVGFLGGWLLAGLGYYLVMRLRFPALFLQTGSSRARVAKAEASHRHARRGRYLCRGRARQAPTPALRLHFCRAALRRGR
jgi:membrane-associated phospholipid phosphatase